MCQEPRHWDTLTACLERTARRFPQNGVTTYSRRGDTVTVSYAELLAKARSFAGDIVEVGVPPGDRIGLLMQNSSEFFIAFFACLYARVTAVPLPVPIGFGPTQQHSLRRIRAIIDSSRLKFIIEGSGFAHRMELNGDVQLVTLKDQAVDATFSYPRGEPQLSDISIVQFTSGTVNAPKGVVLEQKAVAANTQAIRDAVSMAASDIIDLWIPLYHDMGLIGALTAIVSGGNLRICAPQVFLSSPLQWLINFARKRATISATPHFFFRMLIDEYDSKLTADLDLSAWRVAFNGSEPIRASDLREFSNIYAQHRFQSNTLYPVYGLAESTLAVTFPQYGSKPRIVNGREVFRTSTDTTLLNSEFVSVGRPLAGTELRIDRNAPGQAELCLPEEVGQLVVRGPSLMKGYLDNPEATASALNAEGWLLTRDLAFEDQGEVFILGRINDVLNYRGRNYFCDEIERVLVDENPGVYEFDIRRRAAFEYTVEDQQGIGLGIEIRHLEDEQLIVIMNALCEMSLAHFGIDIVVFVFEPGAITQTTSGKLERTRLAMRMKSGEISPRLRFPSQVSPLS